MPEVNTTRKLSDLVSFARAFAEMTPSDCVPESVAKKYLKIRLKDYIIETLNCADVKSVNDFVNYIVEDDAACRSLLVGVRYDYVPVAFSVIKRGADILDENIPNKTYSAIDMMSIMQSEINKDADNGLISFAFKAAMDVYIDNIFKKINANGDKDEYEFADAILNNLNEHYKSIISIDNCINIIVSADFIAHAHKYIAKALATYLY